MKTIILSLILSFTSILQAQSFSKHNILGVWEVSAKNDLRGFAVFGKDFSTTRGETYTIIFSKNNKVKNNTTGEIYHYEVIDGQIKIYQSKFYSKNNYKIKQKNKYDLFAISGTFEGCKTIEITKKRISGYYRKGKNGYKWCKVQDYPKATFYTNEDFKF